jgi:RIO kinase 1
MRIPNTLVSLAEQGIIEEVVRPLMSGKEAEVFLVVSGGELRVAKVYKEAQNRTFKNRAAYTEGRKVRNSRDQRAIDKRSRHGRAQDEAAWRSTEVDMIYRLRDAGVRVPTPHHFIDGVLLMELITDADGNPAPRLAEVSMTAEEATRVFNRLLAEVVRMLCAGVVHGDLSDFNVLMGADGPVVIDLPQAVDASSNQNARKLLLRDVDNLQRFLSRFVPNQRPRPYAQEMWDLYANSQLTPDTRLGGRYRSQERRVDTASVLELIGDADHDERRRRGALGLSMRGMSATPPPAPSAHSAHPVHPTPSAHPPRRVEVIIAPSRQRERPRPSGSAAPPPGGSRDGGQPRGAHPFDRDRQADPRAGGHSNPTRGGAGGAGVQRPSNEAPGRRSSGFGNAARGENASGAQSPRATHAGGGAQNPRAAQVGGGMQNPHAAQVGGGMQNPRAAQVGGGMQNPRAAQVGGGEQTSAEPGQAPRKRRRRRRKPGNDPSKASTP